RDAVMYRRYEADRPHQSNSKLNALLAEFDAELGATTSMQNQRTAISVPAEVNSDFAAFLGYMIGDGHISEVKRVLGLTTGDEEQADRFAQLVQGLFGIEPRKRWDARRCRVIFSSEDVKDLLKHLGLKTGVCARE